MHAVERLYAIYTPEENIPNIVAIGVRNISSLNRALDLLKANGIPHYAWSEPDNGMGFTSIATVPIDSEKKQALAKYRLWIDNSGEELNSSVVQQQEHAASKAVDAGSIPA